MSAGRGRFIVLEGTDGSGTTTQCELLVRALQQKGVQALGTREPSRGPVGQLLRAALEGRLDRGSSERPSLDWQTFALLFAADRLDHVAEEVVPALDRGIWIVSDRYTLSSLIYQSVTAPDPEAALPWIRELNAHALQPDLVVLLDVDADTAQARRMDRGAKEELFEQRDLQLRLIQGYDNAEHYAPEDAVVHVDGRAGKSAVGAAVLAVVSTRLGLA